MFSSAKRKKRKTRKCLDELRNRSRRNFKVNPLERAHKIKNPILTAERLTLKSVFPKAIRSDTITRPIIRELKHDHRMTSYKDLKSPAKALCQNYLYLCDSKPMNKKSMSDCKETPLLIIGNNSHDSEVNVHSGSLTLMNCNSPMDEVCPFTEQERVENTVSCTVSYETCSPTFQTPCFNMHSVYDDFMLRIPSYLTQVSPTLLQHDPIQNTVKNLQKLYLKSYQQSKENIIYKHVNESFKDKEIQETTIRKNPMDYIKLGQQLRHHIGSGTGLNSWNAGSDSDSISSKGPVGPGSECCSTVSMNSGCSSLENSSFCSGSGPVASPILAQAATSLSSEKATARNRTPPCGLKTDMSPTACTLDTIVCQTPEYNYYAHRLN